METRLKRNDKTENSEHKRIFTFAQKKSELKTIITLLQNHQDAKLSLPSLFNKNGFGGEKTRCLL